MITEQLLDRLSATWRSHGAPIEGGDVLVAGHGCVLVGMGERTSPAAVEALGDDELIGHIGSPSLPVRPGAIC